MSTQLLIIGNGFDLHCGLKSSYKDFFKHTIFDTVASRFAIQQMKFGVIGFWEGLLLEYYNVFGEMDYNWCDIESIIKDVLCSILNIGSDNDSHLGKNILDYVRTRNDLYDQRIYGANKPIEKYIFIYCVRELCRVECDIYADVDRLNYLCKKLLLELRNFERRFCRYMKNCIFDEQNNINKQYVVNAFNLLAQLTGFTMPEYEDIDDIINVDEVKKWEKISTNQSRWVIKEIKGLSEEFNCLKNTNILSFNYTAIFDILDVSSPCAYSNVHGKLCSNRCADGCDSSSVIFGIDDTLIQSQNLNTGLQLFSKTYRKMMDTSAPISILPSNNNRPIEIKFYGHSLGEADYSYFQSIFDYYDLYSNNNVSLIFYYSKGYEQNDDIYRLINSYGKTLANKDQGKNLIHKLLLENRLKIVELLDDVSA